MVRRLHEPDRPRVQALLDQGHRAIGLCNVAIGFQRDLAEIFDVDPGQRAARPRRPEPPDLGTQGARRRRRPPARSCWIRPPTPAPRFAAYLAELDEEIPLEVARTLRRDPLVLPALLLPDRSGDAAASRAGTTAAKEVMRIEAGPARALPRPHPRHEAEAPRGARRRVLQRRGCGPGRVAACGHRRRAGREPAQRRCDREPARRRRRGDRGSHRRRRCAPDRHRAARARDARSRPAREGIRAPRDRCGRLRQPRDRPQGAAGEPARRATTTEPGRCSTRCSPPTSATCPGSSRR